MYLNETLRVIPISLKQITIWGCICSFTISCTGQRKCNNCGMIKYSMKNYNPRIHDYIMDETFWQNPRIWYKDSLAIEEIKQMSTDEDPFGNETKTVSIRHFTFIDIKTRSLYDYTSFSDTAKLIRKYTQSDSIPVPGGWTFYGEAKELSGFEPPENLSDTMIDNVLYKRVKLIYINPTSQEKIREESIAYFRCDIKNIMFSLVKNISKKNGCPCVRKDQIPTSLKNPVAVSLQIEFVANKLTPEELKVFDAWEKNAKKNPVQK
jgi:hypothetical protein